MGPDLFDDLDKMLFFVVAVIFLVAFGTGIVFAKLVL
jgi:hypothetical protein